MTVSLNNKDKIARLLYGHHSEQRLDIQALRGLAVLLVVFYHAKIGAMPSGYLGVDIFFVVSGYLITRLVAAEISSGSFSAKRFYYRRAKRLLPAAYVTFAASAVLAPWFLNQQELRDFAVQLIGAVTFTGNIVLWQQTGYFQGASELKPLLHMWSLAIEEQYYFVLPALLLFARRKIWFYGSILLLVASLSLCIFGGIFKPVLTFYFLPTRAWELLIGSAGALWLLDKSPNQGTVLLKIIRHLLPASLVCLLVMPFVPVVGNHPGLNAFSVCAATLVVLLSNCPIVNSSILVRFFSRFGDMSYSLYLVHWPIIAFLKNSWVGSSAQVPLSLRVASVGLSFFFAYVLYRFVENPIRRSSFNFSSALFFKTALCSLLLVSVTPLVIHFQPQHIDYKEARRPNFGFAEPCEYKQSFVSKAECRNSEKPTLMVWGDSYAMHLVPGLASQWKSGGIIQATRSQCGPFLGVAPKDRVKPETGTFKNHVWAESCIDFNRSVLDFLRSNPSVQSVVLSSPISQYMPKSNVEHVIRTDGASVSLAADQDSVLEALHRTVKEIRSMGKKVVLIAPPPSSDFNIGGCLERQLSGAIALGAQANCVIARSDYQRTHADVLEFLNRAENDIQVSVIRFDPWLCDEKVCKTLVDGTMLYRDGGHFSHAGSKLIAERMDLARLVAQHAR
jgi:peptidoglycan/LPS O-acetylase OafA/YrhL